MGRFNHALTTLSGTPALLWVLGGLLVVGSGWLVVRRLARGGQLSPGAFLLQMAIHLSPVVLLSAVFLLAGPRLQAVDVAGTSLSALILAAAVTTPWLSQALTAPFYLEYDAYDRFSPASVARHFLSRWPSVALQSVPASILVGSGLTLLLGWSALAGAYLCTLLLVNVLFAQSLTPAYMSRSGLHLVVAWAAYAIALAVLPTTWWLPPLAGLVTQVILAVHHLDARLPAPRRIPRLGLGAIQGALTASALWALPLALYLRAPEGFPAALVFASLVPAALMYQAFFAQVSESLNEKLARFWHDLENGSAPTVRENTVELYTYVKTSVRTVLVGGVLLAAVGLEVVNIVSPDYTAIFALLSAAALVSCLTTLHAYQLALLQRRRLSFITAAALLVITLGFALSGVGATTFVALVLATSLVSAAVVILAARAGWRSGAYTLFWSRALGA